MWYDEWLENLGDGKLPRFSEDNASLIQLPEDLCYKIEDGQEDGAKNDAISFVFGDIKEKSNTEDWMDFVSSRAILAPTNKYVDEINNICLNKLPGEEIVLPSADSTVNPDDAVHYPVEYINTLQPSGMPAHKLTLKKKTVMVLLGNLNISGVLCNGTRLIVEDVINNRLIRATIANGHGKGRIVLIP